MLPIMDAHCDTVQKMVDQGVDILIDTGRSHVCAPGLLEAGVRCQVFACFVTRQAFAGHEAERLERLLRAVEALDDAGPFVLPRSAEALRALAGSRDRVGVLLAVEGGEALGGDPGGVAMLARRGVCYITLAWGDNELTGSAFGGGGGLTHLGRAVVRELERHRVLVDVSHMSDRAFHDVAAMAGGPFIASHSNCRALCAVPRNLTDAQLRVVADSGGVVGVNVASGFLSQASADAQAPIFKRYFDQMKGDEASFRRAGRLMDEALRRTPAPPLSAVADHVDHIVQVAGIRAAALGSDLDGITRGPSDLDGCRSLATVMDLLRARGYSEPDLRKVAWDNWERLFAATLPR